MRNEKKLHALPAKEEVVPKLDASWAQGLYFGNPLVGADSSRQIRNPPLHLFLLDGQIRKPDATACRLAVHKGNISSAIRFYVVILQREGKK